MSELDRRKLLCGLGALLAAPAIVRAASLMPVRALPPDLWPSSDMIFKIGLSRRACYRWVARPGGDIVAGNGDSLIGLNIYPNGIVDEMREISIKRRFNGEIDVPSDVEAIYFGRNGATYSMFNGQRHDG